MEDFSAACQQAARIGGEQLLLLRDRFQTRKKNTLDFVTDADIASQTVIHDFLMSRFPDHGFLGEEQIPTLSPSPSKSVYRWVVDPLDGTLNYMHRLQSYSVSVALQRNHQIIAAAVFDPLLEEMFVASESTPAMLNGQPIGVSRCAALNQALVVVSLPAGIQSSSPELEPFLKILFHARSVRRLGSAALNLCYVAAGRLDAYWATTVNLWDIAAGWLILEQAGGTMRDLSGQPLDAEQPKFAASASLELCEEIERLLR